jgi:hypothetical protein
VASPRCFGQAILVCCHSIGRKSINFLRRASLLPEVIVNYGLKSKITDNCAVPEFNQDCAKKKRSYRRIASARANRLRWWHILLSGKKNTSRSSARPCSS